MTETKTEPKTRLYTVTVTRTFSYVARAEDEDAAAALADIAGEDTEDLGEPTVDVRPTVGANGVPSELPYDWRGRELIYGPREDVTFAAALAEELAATPVPLGPLPAPVHAELGGRALCEATLAIRDDFLAVFGRRRTNCPDCVQLLRKAALQRLGAALAPDVHAREG